MDEKEKHQKQIEAEASRWVIQMGSSNHGLAEQARLEAWRKQSTHHENAYQFARRTWEELAGLTVTSERRERKPLSPAVAKRAFFAKPGVWALGALAASSLLIIMTTVFFGVDPVTLMQSDHHTLPGQIRTVALVDGSTVQLNTETAIAIRFNERERRVALIEGEATFTVSPSQGGKRPFIVEAAGLQVKALGTEFIVRRNRAEVDVTVVDHSVEVGATHHNAPRPASILLNSGEGVHYDTAEEAGLVRPVNLERATAWQRGQLVFDRVPLSEVADNLSRYLRGRIVITRADLADREVSGVFRVDQLGKAVDIISAEVGAQSVQIPPFLTILY